MKKFNVLLTGRASLYVDVVAESEEEAERIAENRFHSEAFKTVFNIDLENTEAYEGN